MGSQMELSLKPSRLHLAIIVVSFSWALFAVWYSSLWLVVKIVSTLFILGVVTFEWTAWQRAPVGASLRREKIYLHSEKGEIEPISLSGARIQLFWVGLSGRRFRQRIYLFQDSLSKRDWCALRRAIKSASQELSSRMR